MACALFKLLAFFVILCATGCDAFVPAKLMRLIIDKADDKLKLDFGEVSASLVHEDIIKRGIVRSVAKYMNENPTNVSKINMSRLDSGDYYNLRTLYYDYYGRLYCTIDLDKMLTTVFQPNVAIVDFDSATKDLPDAHFDAERFYQSNQRVINFTQTIYSYLSQKSYTEAAKLSGQVMHTVQDFYSHSNWVEMGNNQINSDIGTANFANQLVATQSDNLTCVSNCTLSSIQCSTLVNIVVSLIAAAGVNTGPVQCPLQYYRCQGNIVKLDKLVSGYYTNQELSDGTPIAKPANALKCSHGGILDSDTFKPATGGINKDSGYYLFSPHADLHLTAANLAILHTEYFFNTIRTRIGDAEFVKFLQLEPKNDIFNYINSYVTICSKSSAKPAPVLVMVLLTSIISLVCNNIL